MLTSLRWPLCGCCSSESYCDSVRGDAYPISCRRRKLGTAPLKRSIVTIFAALIAFVAFADARGQSSSVVKTRTLQIDVEARPEVGQFVPADDDVQHLVYELFIANWNHEDLRFASVDVEDAATGKRLARFDSKALEDPIRIDTIPFVGKSRPGKPRTSVRPDSGHHH